jgi:hypothetical protein
MAPPIKFVFPPVIPQPPENLVLWYDFTDITQLFQNTGATTPITADGQIVNACTNKGSAAGSTAISGVGVSTGPTYRVDQMNGFSGLQFTAASFQELIAENVTVASPNTQISEQLLVCKGLGVPGNDAIIYSPGTGNMDSRYRSTTLSISSSKAFQTFTHSGTPFEYAMWGRTSATEEEVSLNRVAGTNLYVYSPDSWGLETVHIGGRFQGLSFFLDNMVVTECLFWAATGLPTTGEMETYVTDKYGLTWA